MNQCNYVRPSGIRCRKTNTQLYRSSSYGSLYYCPDHLPNKSCVYTYADGTMCRQPGEPWRSRLSPTSPPEILCQEHTEGLPHYYERVKMDDETNEPSVSSLVQSYGKIPHDPSRGIIAYFRGPYAFLSNFWPCSVMYEGLAYSSVEHAYQAAKTLDRYQREQIRFAGSAREAKRLGRVVTLRPDWEEIKIDVMRALLEDKFSHAKLAQWLVDTGDKVLMEGNDWGDTFWGVTVEKGGQNWLGQLLMEVRTKIRAVNVQDIQVMVSGQPILLDPRKAAVMYTKDGRTVKVLPPVYRALPGTTIILIEVGPTEDDTQNPV